MTSFFKTTVAASAMALVASSAFAAEITYVSGAVGNAVEDFKKIVAPWEAKTGHTVKLVPMPASTTDQFGQYRLWLAAGNGDIDLYQTDVIWAPQLADHFVDMSEKAGELMKEHFPSIVESQTVDGKLVALPLFTDAPALYYRKDLLEKHGEAVPTTWQQLTDTAQRIMDAERAAGNDDMYGFVWQGAAYEGLTCDAQEWIHSSGGGRIVELDGSIQINNEKAAAALNLAKSWVGGISPEGVLNYKEEDARGVFQSGNAVFMRNWNYAYALGNGDDSPIKGKFDVAVLPHGEGGQSTATLGGWHLGVSKYGKNQEAAIELVRFLNNFENQKERAIITSRPPTVSAVYLDPEVGEKQEFIPLWKPVVDNALPRPSAATLRKYNEVSSAFWTAVHNTLSDKGSAEENLAKLESDLNRLRGPRW